ncbi:MAG: hypothetical protein GXO75_15165 [Calditrichaeota bacterium]|nr:hypothetical protein [Calditrichota bacterium]
MNFFLFYGLVILSNAQTINARFTTLAYNWQQRESETETANHFRAFQLAQISIAHLGLANLSFHTNLQFSHDFASRAVNDPRLWIYNCYFDLRNIGKVADVRVGRQRIYAGVGYGTVDGVQLKYRVKDYFRIKFYLGTLAPLRKSYQIEDIKTDNISWGFHLTTAKFKNWYFGLSFANQSRMPIKYTSPGRITGTFRLDHPLQALERQLVGLDVSRKIGTRVSFNGRLDYNLLAKNIKRAELGGRYFVNSDFEVGLDYIYRMPFINYNSIFFVFEMNPNQELAVHTNYRWNQMRFFLNFSYVFFEGDDNQRVGFGASWKRFYVGYMHRSGYGGDSDGINAHFNYFLRKKLLITLGSNLAFYKFSPRDGSRDQVLANVVGLNYKPIRTLSLQAELQYLNNVRFSNDIRFLFRGSYAFFHNFRH